MKSSIKINVTQECLDAGRSNNSTSCPIARALELTGFEDPSVGNNKAIALWNRKHRHLKLPAVARNFIQAFDGRLGDGEYLFFPFQFEVEL